METCKSDLGICCGDLRLLIMGSETKENEQLKKNPNG